MHAKAARLALAKAGRPRDERATAGKPAFADEYRAKDGGHIEILREARCESGAQTSSDAGSFKSYASETEWGVGAPPFDTLTASRARSRDASERAKGVRGNRPELPSVPRGDAPRSDL
jgi:hypothetical protein